MVLTSANDLVTACQTASPYLAKIHLIAERSALMSQSHDSRMPSSSKLAFSQNLGHIAPPSSKASSSQLTIFYGGTVVVYDDVEPDTAQKVMLLAACGGKKRSSVGSISAFSSFSSLPVTSMDPVASSSCPRADSKCNSTMRPHSDGDTAMPMAKERLMGGEARELSSEGKTHKVYPTTHETRTTHEGLKTHVERTKGEWERKSNEVSHKVYPTTHETWTVHERLKTHDERTKGEWDRRSNEVSGADTVHTWGGLDSDVGGVRDWVSSGRALPPVPACTLPPRPTASEATDVGGTVTTFGAGASSPLSSFSQTQGQQGQSGGTTPLGGRYSQDVASARRASLSRFLEERKMRLRSLAPYSLRHPTSTGSLQTSTPAREDGSHGRSEKLEEAKSFAASATLSGQQSSGLIPAEPGRKDP